MLDKLIMGPTLLVALLLITMLFRLAGRSKRKSISKKIPLLPSPPGLPFIAYPLVVSSPSTAREIIRTHDLVFASRPSLKAARILLYNNNDMVLAPYGEYWRLTRKICVSNLLSLKMIQSFSLVRMEEVSLMIERIARMASANKGIVSVSEILNTLTCDVLCKSVLGSSMSEERRKFLCELIRLEYYFPLIKSFNQLIHRRVLADRSRIRKGFFLFSHSLLMLRMVTSVVKDVEGVVGIEGRFVSKISSLISCFSEARIYSSPGGTPYQHAETLATSIMEEIYGRD
ncbi:hypothetical protein M5K25_004021 [Dendrobium thyrsiflorum]|uniref:Cytochrome P450 n=1 Tax=Dendrobium thyrsiflorum TaxID=117978 RepID=A0ABD0VSY6_DENTH